MTLLPRKCLLLMLDGVADRAWPVLDHRTPLQAARTPALDRLAAEGACGLWHASSPGRALPSEIAHFLLMGYTMDQFPGRGWLEAQGQGIDCGPGDVALLARLAVCCREGGGLIIGQRKPVMDPDEEDALLASVAEFESPLGRAVLHPSGKGQAVLVLHGDFRPWISDSDPLVDGLPVLEPVVWAEHQSDSKAAAARDLLVQYLAWAHRRLSGGRVNAVITHRPGQRRDLPPVDELWGLKVGSVSSHRLYRGIFQAMGAETNMLPHHGPVGELAKAKLEAALEMLQTCDFVHLHFKEPDDAAHEGDPAAKVKVLEELDAAIGPRLERLAKDGEVLLCLTGDHATPSGGSMIHAGQPSPLVLHGIGQWRDKVSRFDEVSCAAGSLSLLRGGELMQTLLCGLDRARLAGLRDGPVEVPFFPGHGQPLLFKD